MRQTRLTGDRSRAAPLPSYSFPGHFLLRTRKSPALDLRDLGSSSPGDSTLKAVATCRGGAQPSKRCHTRTPHSATPSKQIHAARARVKVSWTQIVAREGIGGADVKFTRSQLDLPLRQRSRAHTLALLNQALCGALFPFSRQINGGSVWRRQNAPSPVFS